MPKIHVLKSIYINATPEKIYEKLADFNHWEKWSPWLIMEPNVKVNVADGGKEFSWEGNRVGAGKMNITAEKEFESITQDLNFLKPFKSYAKIAFNLKPNGNGTDVSWSMDSSLPFFMFWMKKMMKAYIGMDYHRGLLMLKDLVEDGKVHSELEFKGISTYEGCKYIGVKSSSTIDNLKTDMDKGMNKLKTFVENNSVQINGKVISIYHKWDMISRNVEYTIAFAINDTIENVNGEIIVGEIPKIKVNSVRHKGAYQHLGNAWGAQYMMQRNKEFKINKAIDPFEIYLNNPEEIEKSELLTDIHFAIK